MLKIASWNKDRGGTYRFPRDNAFSFCTQCIVPLLIALRMHDITTYHSFIAGINPEPLLDILRPSNFCCQNLLTTEEQSTVASEKRPAVFRERILQVYQILFADAETYCTQTYKIGRCDFSRLHKDHILKIANMMSDLTDYGEPKIQTKK